MIGYVNLSDIASNKFQKRVGFSYYYLCFGPFYLLFRLKISGFILLLVYYLLLPIPGIKELSDLISNQAWNSTLIDILTKSLDFFRAGWNQLSTYLGIILVIIIHIFYAYNADNWILKKKIKKYSWYPVSQQDARKLIYYHICKSDIKLANEVLSEDELKKMALANWEQKNITFTSMIPKSAIDSQKSKSSQGRIKRLYSTNTGDITKPYVENLSTQQVQLIKLQHEENLRLYKEKKISKAEYELLEDRLYKNKNIK